MGLESYNFLIVRGEKTSPEEFEKTIVSCGFVQFKKSFSSTNYERRKETSILELQVIVNERSNKIEYISLRFCISNPIQVVDDLFKFLKKLSSYMDINVYEFQGDKLIYSKNENRSDYVKERTIAHKKWFENLYGKVDKPITCDEYWDYVKKHKLGKAKWGKTQLFTP